MVRKGLSQFGRTWPWTDKESFNQGAARQRPKAGQHKRVTGRGVPGLGAGAEAEVSERPVNWQGTVRDSCL